MSQGWLTRTSGRPARARANAALTAFAFGTPRVHRVLAHTLPVANASSRVLTKCGFRQTGTVVDADDGPVWRWERSR